MFKKFSLAVVAVVLMAGSSMADDLISASDLDSAADATNTAIESSIEVESGDLAVSDDSATEAVEACFRGWGGGCCHYNYCYRPCYNYCYTPCYSYCYQPCYTYCYRPVCYTYTCYQPVCYPLYHWGCY